MEQIKFSVVITVLNEEFTIKPLLDSLINQSTQPCEIIVVDAGSSDKTVELVTRYKSMLSSITLLVCSGINRSAGRNVGIKVAKSTYIAVTDAGCIADHTWLEHLAESMSEMTESVAGFYKPIVNKPIQELFSHYVATNEDSFDSNTYLPSSRSLAFTKSVWKKIGEYPETLDTCEDLVFAERLKARGTMSVNKKALVFWIQADNLTDFYKQIKGYARGDVDACYRPHLKKIATVWIRYFLFIVFPPFFLIYLWYPYIKFWKLRNTCSVWYGLPVIQLVSDVGVMMGCLEALYKRTNP